MIIAIQSDLATKKCIADALFLSGSWASCKCTPIRSSYFFRFWRMDKVDYVMKELMGQCPPDFWTRTAPPTELLHSGEKFNMAATAALDSVRTTTCQYDCLQDAIFTLCQILCMCNKRVVSVKQNSKWRPPPSWIYFWCQFPSHDPFQQVAIFIPAKFCKRTSAGIWVTVFCGKILYGGSHHLGFCRY